VNVDPGKITQFLRKRWPWLALLLLSAVLHLWVLGDRSFHHDEAIHAHGAYNLLKNGIYRYDPTYHGPLLYYLTAASYAVFGDTDFTARLPIAVAGILLLAVAWSLRRPFGERAAWWTGLLATLSPDVLYYGRFLRMDVLELLLASAAFVAAWRASWGRASAWIWVGVWGGLAYTTKENAYVTSALVVAVWGVSGGLRVLGRMWDGFVDWVRDRAGSLVLVLVRSQFTAMRDWVVSTVSWLWGHRWGLLGGVAASVLVMVPIFTVGFRYPEDWFFPGKAIGYWWGQHSIARVAGPWWYHLPRQALYNFLPLAAATVWVVRRRRRLGRVELSLFLFGVLSLAIYAYLREKVPWLGVHQVWAFLPLAGSQLARTFSARGRWWSRAVAGTGLAVTVAFSIGANFFWSEVSPNMPRVEALTYVQTCPDLKPVIREGYRLRDEGVDPVAAVAGEAGWPLTWYWRTTPTWWSEPKQPMRPPLVLCNPEQEPDIRQLLGPGYTSERIPLRAWWILEDWVPNPGDVLRYVVHRVPWGVVGSSDIMVLRISEGPIEWARPVDPPPSLAAELPITGARVFGEGWLAEPRGVAVRADGLVAVADVGTSSVVLFSDGGEPLEVVVPEELQQPEAVSWTPDGMLVIADTWGHRVVLFDLDTSTLQPLPDPPGGWYGPRGVAVAESGLIAVTDTGNKRIVLMGTSGGTVTTRVIGSEGSRPGEVVEPVGLAWLDRERLLVCDTGNGRLQVVDLEGAARRVVELPDGWTDFYSRPQAAALGAELWLVSDTPAGGLWLIRDDVPVRLPTADDGLTPTGVAFDGSRLYIADMGGRLWVFDLNMNS
jgi:uncharacterized protein (TIGR03663 family)